MPTIHRDPRAPRQGSHSGDANNSGAKPHGQEEYQSAKGCLLLVTIGIVSFALICLGVLLFGKFD